MEVRTLADPHPDRLYLTKEEYELVLNETLPALEGRYDLAHDHHQYLTTIRMMGECGLRRDGCLSARRGEFFKPYDSEVSIWFLKILGKDSKPRDTDGKRRDVWVPADVKKEVEEHIDNEDISVGDELFDYSESTLSNKMSVIGDHLADLTENDDWRKLSSHDFRTYFACRLNRAGVSDRIATQLGGWDDLESYRKYKVRVTKKRIQNELAAAGLLEADVGVSEEDFPFEDRVLNELEKIREYEEEKCKSWNGEGCFDQANPQLLYCHECGNRNHTSPDAVEAVRTGKLYRVTCPDCDHTHHVQTSY